MSGERPAPFSVDLPATWETRHSTVFGAPPAGGTVRPNLVVSSRPARGKDLATAAHEAKKGLLSQQFPELKFGEEGPATLAGHKGHRLAFTHAVQIGEAEPARLARAHVLAITDGTIIEAHLTAAQDAPEQMAVLEAMLDSLQIT